MPTDTQRLDWLERTRARLVRGWWHGDHHVQWGLRFVLPFVDPELIETGEGLGEVAGDVLRDVIDLGMWATGDLPLPILPDPPADPARPGPAAPLPDPHADPATPGTTVIIAGPSGRAG